MGDLTVVWVQGEDEAHRAIREGKAQVAFTVGMFYDDPPGDWYVEFDVYCADPAITARVNKACLPFRPADVLLVLAPGHLSGVYMTDKCYRSVVRRPEEETEEFLRSWDPVVEEKATVIQLAISKV